MRFLFWGAATNDRVYKFDENRIKKELTWISSEMQTPFISIADANWSMLKRDIIFSQHIADCKEENETPVYVYFSAAKNSPKRVSEITAIFTEAGLINYQPISVQSLHEPILKQIDRKKIRISAYEELQEDLNIRGISSFIELIWSLPGETLQSYMEAIETLFERNASIIIVYPHVLLHNTTLSKKREEFRLVTRMVRDHITESEIVVQTADITHDEFIHGIWFNFLLLAFHNSRSFQSLIRYLHGNKIMRLFEFYSKFIEFSQRNLSHPFSHYIYQTIEDASYLEISNFPLLYVNILHTNRDRFDSLIYEFARNQDWWNNEDARFLFELNMIKRPFIYSNTEMNADLGAFKHIKVINQQNHKYLLQIPLRFENFVNDSSNGASNLSNGDEYCYYLIDHQRDQFPYREGQANRTVADYCQGVIMTIVKILPKNKKEAQPFIVE